MELESECITSAATPPCQAPHVPSQWADALHEIAGGSPSPPIVVICGPKNSGKSTFSRLLLNSFLQRYDRVGYMDTDVGQPEFFVPGCLSLHLVDECLPDVMSTSIKKPERCFFFGDISSKRDPEAYMDCMFRLYDYFIKEYHRLNDHNNNKKSSVPLIINTAGWVKGTGFDVLVELLRHVSPTHVVKIRISVETKNLPTGAFWLNNDKKVELSELIEVDAVFTNSYNQSVLMGKNANRMRESRLLDYFKQCFPSSLNIKTNKELAYALAALPPYQVHFSEVKVMHLHCQVPKHEVFHSLNATIVCLAFNSFGPTTIECRPWCAGLGIVRGIDVKKDLLYVLTPLSLSELEKIDILLQGFIQIPTVLLQVKGCRSPYMAANVLRKLPYRDL